MFYTAPHAFDIAAQLSRTLLGCDPGWTVRLPPRLLLRQLRMTTLGEVLYISEEAFVKHAVSKAFPAGVYDAASLAEATSGIPPESLVHVGESVEWSVEYRCFVIDRAVATISPYRRHGRIIEDHEDLLAAPQSEMDEARQFAESVLDSPEVDCPPAFVLDVGVICGRGWAVVEPNECWASGCLRLRPGRRPEHAASCVCPHGCDVR